MRKYLLASAFGLAAVAYAPASAQAIIDNGTIQLGVDSLGQLNIYEGSVPSAGGTFPTGLRDLRTGYESTSPGCLCEGWGVSDGVVSGYANNSAGIGGLTFVSFSSTASTATTVSTMGGIYEITHVYSPSSEANLYQVDVTVKNISGAATSKILYRRTMDWDIEPTAFREYSTIQGTVGATNVIGANDNGFCSSDPLSVCSPLIASGDFIDSGPYDHGANFDFKFDGLGADESYTFTIFYGAAPTERGALLSLFNVGAEIYSLGQSANDRNGNTPGYSTFIFGFKGVGGVIVDPGGVPEPATWAMLIAGFGMVGVAARRRRQTAVSA
jgi:type IV pilus assembly protein PilY1